MTVDPPVALRRPVVVTIAIVLVYLSGIADVVIGTLVLLSRYQVVEADVLPVSLLGAFIILFGLLTLAVASGLSRGSRLARLLLTLYLALQSALQIVTIVVTEVADLTSSIEIVLQVLVVAALWAPPGGRFFRRAPVSDTPVSDSPVSGVPVSDASV